MKYEKNNLSLLIIKPPMNYLASIHKNLFIFLILLFCFNINFCNAQNIKATWLYNFDNLKNKQIINNLKLNNINTVFLSVHDYNNKKYKKKLNNFLKKAENNKIDIHAMILQDANFVYIQNHQAALKKINYIIKFNKNHKYKFSGIHLDVEPYTLDSWEGNKQDLMVTYKSLIKKIHIKINKQNLLLSEAVPWWYVENGYPVHKKYSDFIVIMCYDGIGGNYRDIYWRVKDEINIMPTVVGVGVNEFKNKSKLDSTIKKINNRFKKNKNYLGKSIFHYNKYLNKL